MMKASAATPRLIALVPLAVLAASLAAGPASAAAMQPPAPLVTTSNYLCKGGGHLRVRYDNSGNFALAFLVGPQGQEVRLVVGESGSGVLYTNGTLTLQTERNTAVLEAGKRTLVCKEQ